MGRLWMLIATGAAILLLSLLFGLAYPRTKYASGFSEAKFREIRIGMSRDEVRKLLGEPLDVFGFAPDERLRYSRDEYGGPLDLGWHVRHLILSNDIVVLKLSAIDWWVPWDSPYNYKM